MTYRKRLKSSAPVFFVVGTLIFAGVEESSAQSGKVYSTCEEMRKDVIAAQVDGCHEAVGSFRAEAQSVGYDYEGDMSCSWDGGMMGELSRAEAAGFISVAKLAEAEKFYQGVEGCHDPTDLRQFCEWAGCIVDDKHDENINEAVVNRYEKRWTEDRQNDDTNSWNSSESEYESSKKYEHEKNSERINILKTKLNSRESPYLTALKEAVPITRIKMLGKGVKKVGKKVGGRTERYGEMVDQGAEKIEEVKDQADREKKRNALIFGNDEDRREAMKELTKEGKIEAARLVGGRTGGAIGGVLGPKGAAVGAAIGSAYGAGSTARTIAQKEIDRDAESIKSIEEDNKNFALVEKAAEGNKEAKDAIFSVFGKNNEGDSKAPSEHNFLQTLRRNQAQKLKATIAAGSGPMTPHLDHMKKKLGRKVEKSLKEEEGP